MGQGTTAPGSTDARVTVTYDLWLLTVAPTFKATGLEITAEHLVASRAKMEGDRMDSLTLHARNLVRIRKQMQELRKEAAAICAAILPELEERREVEVEGGRVYFAQARSAKSFSRRNVLKHVRERFGESIAEELDFACTRHGEPRRSVYVSFRLRREASARRAA